MKRILLLASLLIAGFATGAAAQSNQAPVLQQATSTEDNRRANPPKPMLENNSMQQRMELERGLDTTLPKQKPKRDRKQRRLRPDSLRRGGATRIDTVR
ncbi:hypothetical protein WBJ53_29435 [Spirosoma sp. SC4-14]|uniref:hypothetical protein n=1 Tax=Spirosoma sp. SC4-14 TaxID=3128900 RepID=UPI0030D5F86E